MKAKWSRPVRYACSSPTTLKRQSMNIHEYQAKSLLAKFGVAVPRGAVAYTSEEAESAARELGGPVWVVKSQIHAGGRGAGRFQDNPAGKGGGRAVHSRGEGKANAEQIRGNVRG